MNATPAVFQAQRSNDALQLDASASSAPQASRADGQDFAKALSDAGPKPGRKNTAGRHQDAAPSGSALPPPGNQPPPANTVNPATVAQAPNQAGANTAAGAAGIAAGAPAVQSDAAPPDSGGQAVMPGKAAPAQAALNITDPATALLAGPMPVGADALAPDPALTTPHDAGIHTPPTPAPTPAPTAAPTVAAAISANPRAGALPAEAPAIRVPAAPVSAAESKAAIAASTSGPSSPDTSTASNEANADAAAAAVLASAAVPAGRAPSTDSSPSDTFANPDDTAALQGTAAANDSPPPMLPAPVVSGHALAAPTAAAAAASAARAAVGAAESAATDKHSRDNSADSSLSAASNDGTAGAALLLTSNAPGDSTLTPTFKVAAGVDTPYFGQGVADRVSLMVDSNLTSAKLQVNPPSLGPIEVRIALQAGHAQVWLSSHSALTRDALESSSPKLREMLGAQGFAQVSVDISQRSFQERLPQSQVYESAPSISGGTPAVSQAAAAMSRTANGLLDAYA
jgi:flagellar hook-length control protein FliK